MIPRPAQLLVLLLLALAHAHAPTLGATPATRPRPNVVILLADDAGWGDFSTHGNPDARTPNIDSLARDGVSARWFFVQPVCAPTRAEFLTGRYHPRSGVRGVSTGQERMNPGTPTVADAFKAAGYATGAFGKWHNGSQGPHHPNARGFDEFFGYTAGHWGEYVDPELERNGRLERTRGYIVDVCTDAALDFISRHKDRPFLCYVPFTTPHSPWSVPESDWARHRDKPLSARATQPADENPDHTRCVHAMMENQDRNVGRILHHLDSLGLRTNTIVVYFSDNGPNTARWNGGMKGRKGGTDDGSIRSPLFIRWPARLPKGRTIEPVAGAIDLLPTLADLAGIPLDRHTTLDGRNLAPLLTGATDSAPDRILFAHWSGRTSARTDRHRLDADGRLFDITADPAQTRDIAAEHPAVAQRLRDAVAQWRAELLPLAPPPPAGRSVDPRPFPVGYPGFPITLLPARDAEPHGTVRRSSSAPNSSYFVHWTSTSDRITWNVHVHTPGLYEVVLDYTCPEPDAGSEIILRLGTSELRGRVSPAWDPPLYTNQDTLPRPPAESRMKEFRPLHLGRIRLEAGPGELSLQATSIPGNTVMDLRRLTLTHLP